MDAFLDRSRALPQDGGTLVGRARHPRLGPCVVAVREGALHDLTPLAPTMSGLLDAPDRLRIAREAKAERLGSIEEVLADSHADRASTDRLHLLAPCDLQAVKAAGVTFIVSLLERVVEEQARGDAAKAEAIRGRIMDLIGVSLSAVKPGSEAAAALKEHFVSVGAWSQYLEVGIGPDAEIFTKAQPLSSVGTGALVGVHPKSEWSNPEPEIVLAADSRGAVVGAALGNDVNLRDFEGRSALLLSKAKDNNASCAIGPFIRLFDEGFGIDDVRNDRLTLQVEGLDGFRMDGESVMSAIARDPLDLAGATCDANHQYPDGFVLFLGTMFAPIQDRGAAGKGFTHKIGDVVAISSPKLGTLVNRVARSDEAPRWTFGARDLMRALAGRGLTA